MSESQWLIYTIVTHLIGSQSAIYISTYLTKFTIRDRINAMTALLLCYLPYILLVGVGFMHYVHRWLFYWFFPLVVIATGGLCAALTFVILGTEKRHLKRDYLIPVVYTLLTGSVLLGYIVLIRHIGG